MSSRSIGHRELHDIQGNIVRGYRLPRVAHLFGAVSPTNVQRWRDALKALDVTPECASSKPRQTRNVGISHAGMRLLVPHVARELELFEAFMSGMPARAALLRDPSDVPWAQWESRHVWIAIHASDEAHLSAEIARLQDELEGLLTPTVLLGQAITRDGSWVEPFGFRDDLSQPAIAGAPNQDKLLCGGGKPNAAREGWLPIAAGEFVLGHLNERGRDVLEGRPALQSILANGTFAAFRELVQDVALFETTVATAASSWGVSEQELKAKLVGRHPDGTPLATSHGKSDFTYDDDPQGTRCPMGAHVRRANPRLAGEHRVIRRGMPFRQKHSEATPSSPDVQGMYLVALNASLENQFEFIQSMWLNNPVGALPGSRDPLVGEGSGPKRMAFEGDMAARRDPILLNLPSFVSCRGGQYYFMPGLRGLQQIADARWSSGFWERR